MDLLSPNQVRAISGVGLGLYAATAAYCGSYALRSRYRYTKRFFLLTAAFALLEIPRAAVCLAHGAYTGVPEFAVHLLANACFALAVTVMCYIWHDITSVTPRPIIHPKGVLAGLNAGVVVVHLLAIVACLSYNSLHDFLHSEYYAMYATFDTVFGLLACLGIVVLGQRLHTALRLWEKHTNVGRVTSNRLLVLMVLACVSLVVRALMLVSLFARLNPARWRPYESLWWLLADTIARCAGAVLFSWFLFRRDSYSNAQGTATQDKNTTIDTRSSGPAHPYRSYTSNMAPSSVSEFDMLPRISTLYPPDPQLQQQVPTP